MKNNKSKVLNHDFGYGLNVSPNKIKKLFLSNIDELKLYIKDVVYTNLIETNKLKLEEINKIINIEKLKYKLKFFK